LTLARLSRPHKAGTSRFCLKSDRKAIHPKGANGVMTLDEIRGILIDHIMDKFGVEPDDDEFTPDVHLFDYGYIDSFGATELTAFVESRFGVEVTKKDLMTTSMNTVNEIASFIASKLGAN